MVIKLLSSEFQPNEKQKTYEKTSRFSSPLNLLHYSGDCILHKEDRQRAKPRDRYKGTGFSCSGEGKEDTKMLIANEQVDLI